MIARLLLGPAGSGKTHRCREEARAALRADPDGPPLLFLAPKQATFQLERQLLADPEPAGWTRLHILSFERLAEWVLDRVDRPAPAQLDETGRLMVLRSLLERERGRLELFRASARLPGFARELSVTIRELRQYRLGPEHLRRLAGLPETGVTLAAKLKDLARLMEAETDWLTAQGLADEQGWLEEATAALLALPAETRLADALWLDGFAEMTPQEQELLAAFTPHVGEATLAFCLEGPPAETETWLSPWGLVSRSCAWVAERLRGLAGVDLVTERLERRPDRGRFAGNPVLAHLEAAWNAPRPGPTPAAGELAVLECSDPEGELVAAARELVRFVRRGGRWRETAVIVRSLDPYRDRLPRVFRRYGIPFFLDARESVAHHPLAELTRSILRVLAFGWRSEDWFGALKTGLSPADEAQVDRLENEALARGWEGNHWRRGLAGADSPEQAAAWEKLRRRLVQPVEALERALRPDGDAPGPNGRQLARALHGFWRRLRVDRTLDRWAEAPDGGARPQVHRTVLEQMIEWVRAVALAFADRPFTLREWLPVLEAGLSHLSVGVVPPALDQVLVGAVDRSRNPDLRLAVLLGLNEGHFPATPPPGRLLTETDRQTLARAGTELGPDRRWRLGRERYYGYIACTRPGERLVLTFARQDAEGRELNRSVFLTDLARLFSGLSVASACSPDATAPAAPEEVVHPGELLVPALRAGLADPVVAARLATFPEFRGLAPLFAGGNRDDHESPPCLEPALATALYGPDEVRASASGLEDFANCPFKFFVSRGLRAAERRLWELDPRRRGSFCHEVLARYHQEVRRQGRHWRDLEPAEAQQLLERVAALVTGEFEAGMLGASPRHRFVLDALVRRLREFIRQLTEWMRTTYHLDPVAVEWGFGLGARAESTSRPAWTLELEGGRRLALVGKIDRIDAVTDSASGRRLLVVMDYKSSARKLETALLNAGVDLQLPFYALALASLGGVESEPAAGPPEVIGMFYAGLRPQADSAAHHQAAREAADTARARAWQHHGRFLATARRWLDDSPGKETSGQFGSARTADSLAPETYRTMLDRTRNLVRRFGERILAGEVRPDPWVHGSRCACEHCDYAGICRIDPWRHHYRRLTARPAPGP